MILCLYFERQKQHIRGLLNGLNNKGTYIQIWHTLKWTQPQVGKDIFTRT